MKILFLIVIFFLPNYIFSETVKLIDGRTLKLNADGTYNIDIQIKKNNTPWGW